MEKRILDQHRIDKETSINVQMNKELGNSMEDSIILPELMNEGNSMHLDDSKLPLMKVNSIFSNVGPDELLLNGNSRASEQLNNVRPLSLDKFPEESLIMRKSNSS